MGYSNQTGTKEKIDIMFVIFRQIDRVNETMSLPELNHNQVARSIEALKYAAYPIISKKFKTPPKIESGLSPQEYYDSCLTLYEAIMKALESTGVLATKTYVSQG